MMAQDGFVLNERDGDGCARVAEEVRGWCSNQDRMLPRRTAIGAIEKRSRDRNACVESLQRVSIGLTLSRRACLFVFGRLLARHRTGRQISPSWVGP